MTAQISKEHEMERRIAARLVRDALAAGYAISVYDGEEMVLEHSRKAAEIAEAMFSTDSDTLTIGDGVKFFGDVLLIYGNGRDVISDHTDTPLICALVDPVQAYAETVR